MVRIVFTIVLAIVTAAASAAAQVRLRTNVVVDGGQVTLGDIFEDVGSEAQIHVATAPAVGRRLVLRNAEIRDLANKYGLDWRRPGGPVRVEVRRASRIVAKKAMVEELTRALENEGIEGPFRVELRIGTRNLRVAKDAEPTVQIESLDLDRHKRRFTATLAAPAGEATASRIRVSGEAVRITEIPVLRQRMAPGAIIGEDDVVLLSMPAEKVRGNVITDPDRLLGKVPKRVISPGKAVRVRDVQRPVIVKKGALVTMTLTSRGLAISAFGKAIEAGGTGDVIRIRNSRSNIVVQGTITGPSRVAVLSKSQLVDASE